MSWVARVNRTNDVTSNSPEQCKDDIVKLNCALKAIIQDIWECKGPVLALNDLNKDARRLVNELRSKISELDELANVADQERVRLDLKEDVENQTKQLENTQATLRKANLTCKLAIDNREKDALLGSRETRTQQIRHRNTVASRQNIAQSASDITENLLTISRTLDNTVHQSSHALNSLVSSSKTVKDTDTELKNQAGLIQTGHRLLTKYNRREYTDKILIFLALALFFSTVLYILKRRLFPSL
uniref:vesicle transport protein SEC20-like n=1 Tax=Ciona intestinalis TaxID=7719 RepID=UPI000180C972|nr:vesicle transport protein SEC20-like [Ciona intestinalis]|eukprot:XP_002129504.1 vesicle transport protein SEC20-like [Ciona intestinalis]